jgi:hypothetical protein
MSGTSTPSAPIPFQMTVTAPAVAPRPRAASIFFPSNYRNIDHFVTFQVLKFERVTRTSNIASDEAILTTTTTPEQNVTRRGLVNITLPMPASLVTDYSVSYDTPDISSIGEIIATAASNAREYNPRALGRNLGEAISAPFTALAGQGSIGTRITNMHSAIQTSVQRMYQSLGPLAGPAIASTAAGAIGRLNTGFTAALANATGVARNPHKVVLFTGVNFREHKFTYSLTPKNALEAQIIYEIIKLFKYHMSPKYGVGDVGQLAGGLIQGLGAEATTANQISESIEQNGAASRAFFEYPEVFQIKFNKESTLFTIGESVLKSFSINYHPQNYPAYVRSLTNGGSTAYPAEVVIDMTFLETDVVTKEQIDQNGR